MAASTIGSGVGKSGSPAPKPITSRPAALSALALASTASVADSLIEPIRDGYAGAAAGSGAWHAAIVPHAVGAGLPDRPVPRAFDPLVRAVDVHWRVRFGLRQRGQSRTTQGSSSIGRVPVSKTGGWGFESLLPCEVPTGEIPRHETTSGGRRFGDADQRTQPGAVAGGRRTRRAAARHRLPASRPTTARSWPSCARSSGRPATSWSPTRSSRSCSSPRWSRWSPCTTSCSPRLCSASSARAPQRPDRPSTDPNQET